MKLKKLFAGIVAVAMMATMAIPAFANRDVVDTIPVQNGKFTITKTYTIVNGVAPSESFELEQIEKVGTAKSSISTTDFKAGDEYNLKIGTADYTSGSEEAIGFEVTLPNYNNHPGVYTYELKEKNKGTAGVTYDDNTYTLTVYAMQAASENDLTSGNILNYAVRLDVKGTTNKNQKGYKVAGLTNSYTSHSIKVTKKVEGNMADRAETFNFKATFSGLDKMHGSIMVKNAAITLDKDNAYTFSLKHGENIEFTNIPEGVTADVKELNAENVAVEADTTNGTYTVGYKTEMKDNNVEVTVTNTSTENINTGVILDNAPYIALLTIVAAGAVVMIMKKRRNYED